MDHNSVIHLPTAINSTILSAFLHGLGERVQRFGEWVAWKGRGGSNSLWLWMLSATAGGGHRPSQRGRCRKNKRCSWYNCVWWMVVVCVCVYDVYGMVLDACDIFWPLWVCDSDRLEYSKIIAGKRLKAILSKWNMFLKFPLSLRLVSCIERNTLKDKSFCKQRLWFSNPFWMLTFPPRNALLEAFQESSLLRLEVLMNKSLPNHFGMVVRRIGWIWWMC